MPIKYIGSKRRLVPILGSIFQQSGATTALDLFTGTTRVAQEFKARGGVVTAVDTARYSEVFAQCYIGSDGSKVDKDDLREAIDYLNQLPGVPGYFTKTFCEESRYFQPKNGARVDEIRDALDKEFRGSPLFPILLTSLIEAADRVDSTTGVQMAYLKQWAPRAHNDLELRVPGLIPGTGAAIRGDAREVVKTLPPVDLAYLDPPYNQHRYFTNYHIWETLVAWDRPEHYGIACKRIDSRDPSTKSPFNGKRLMEPALAEVVSNVNAHITVLSYNNEAWVTLEELVEMCAPKGYVEVLSFDSKRYVGAQIGIFNPSGKKVGKISHLRNLEYILIAGDKDDVVRTAGSIASSPPEPQLF